MIVVANSSPLISLSAIHSLHILHKLYGTIHIPEAVRQEVVIEGTGRTGAKQVAVARWISRHMVADASAVRKMMETAKLGIGESETIVLALELRATLVLLDERPARRAAQRRHLSVIGSLGALVQAKEQGLIRSVKNRMDALVASGPRIHPTIYQTILRIAGE